MIGELDKRGKEIDLIMIPENVICEHLFLVEVDQDFKIFKTYNVGDLLATEALKSIGEIKGSYDFQEKFKKMDKVDYEGILNEFLINWCNTLSIQREIERGRLQNLIYLYKDLVAGISQIVKDEIFSLLSLFEKNYINILKKNFKNLKICIPPSVVDLIIEKLYRNGLDVLTQFYSIQIIFIEHPFVEALKEISQSNDDDLTVICEDMNTRLADTVKDQFSKLHRQLNEIQYKIYKSLEKFQLQIIPKSVDVTINTIFSHSLNNIVEKLNAWASEWTV